MTARLLRRDSRLSVEPDVKFRVDVWIVVAVVALLVIGFLTVASASPAVIVQFGNDPAAYVGDLQTQFKALLIGAAGIVLILQFDYHDFRAFSLMIIPLLLGSLIAVFIFGSGEQFGGRRSLFGGSIQPAEFAKLLMIMYTSHWLSTRSNQLNSIQQGWVPFSVMVGLVCGLVVAQPDLSTAILIGAVSFALFFLAGASWRHILLSVPVIVAVLFFVISASTYAENRIEAWRTAIVDPRQADDQIKFGQIALSNGGILGKGLGNGEMKFRIQAAHNDYPLR